MAAQANTHNTNVRALVRSSESGEAGIEGSSPSQSLLHLLVVRRAPL
jgi:hypothetical protein